MRISRFNTLLKGGDLSSIGKADHVVAQIRDQAGFDELFVELFNRDRRVVMRAADAIEKITTKNAGYLRPHKEEIIGLCRAVEAIELKWHLALLIPRLDLNTKEFAECWRILSTWVLDRNESRIVRVNAIQALFELSARMKNGKPEFDRIIAQVEQENIPSINARLRKLRQMK